MKNHKIVDAYFKAYSDHNMEAISEVMDENAVWYFIGNNPFSGIKKGIKEIIAFFDAMGKTMMSSKPTIDKVIVADNDEHFIECSHIKTNRPTGMNIDHYVTVLWTIKDGKIVEGRHFFADPIAADKYFNDVAHSQK